MWWGANVIASAIFIVARSHCDKLSVTCPWWVPLYFPHFNGDFPQNVPSAAAWSKGLSTQRVFSNASIAYCLRIWQFWWDWHGWGVCHRFQTGADITFWIVIAKAWFLCWWLLCWRQTVGLYEDWPLHHRLDDIQCREQRDCVLVHPYTDVCNCGGYRAKWHGYGVLFSCYQHPNLGLHHVTSLLATYIEKWVDF